MSAMRVWESTYEMFGSGVSVDGESDSENKQRLFVLTGKIQ